MSNIELGCLKKLKFVKINILKEFINKFLMLFNNVGLQKLIFLKVCRTSKKIFILVGLHC